MQYHRHITCVWLDCLWPVACRLLAIACCIPFSLLSILYCLCLYVCNYVLKYGRYGRHVQYVQYVLGCAVVLIRRSGTYNPLMTHLCSTPNFNAQRQTYTFNAKLTLGTPNLHLQRQTYTFNANILFLTPHLHF